MHLSLRKKVTLHFLIFIIVNGGLWAFSYYRNSTIIRKLIIVEKKKELLDMVLEARRYEKNFFLGKDAENLKIAISYVREMAQKQDEVVREFSAFATNPEDLNRRTEDIHTYKKKLETLYDLCKHPCANAPGVVDIQAQVAEMGRTLTRDVEAFEALEQKQVFRLLDRSRNYLVVSLALLFLLTILTIVLLILNVDRPLKIIERGIRRIARGEFDKIPAISTGDEFESLVKSLNIMINELDKKRSQLAQAEKMSSLGILTFGVAHELNNPLNNISTSIQILREEIGDQDIALQRKMLDRAEQEVDRAQDIIRALLEFSRKTKFSVHPVEFKGLVQSTMRLIAGEIPKNVMVDIQVPDGLTGMMEPRRIQQVMLNLITNGIHAMPDGGHMTINAFLDTSEGKDEFTFQVSDTGTGIADHALDRIFDPFFTTKEVGKGTGLGLSVIHGIIKQHQGQIQVESSPDKGTTFTVTLPAAGTPTLSPQIEKIS